MEATAEKIQFSIDVVDERMRNAIATLTDHESLHQPRVEAKLRAVETSYRIWEDQLEEHLASGKLHKLLRNFCKEVDFQMKHSTGGTNQGYNLVLSYIRSYL